jgi:tetratricopeptide (TPR) repeat protein
VTSMDPDRWAEIQARFHELLDSSDADRALLLSRLALEDHALASEVQSLLAAEAQGPLGRGPAADPSSLVAEYAGPYRLLRRLGEGGMGVVFLAERQEAGFTQRVAIKLLRAGFLDPLLAEHVAHERRVLARLEHPNIARLIDGGTTPSGQPYLAMEYVEGDTLLDYATRRHLSLADRIRLFAEVCEAVHHAHQQLVVHRDLKPGNIMVGLDGRPRLLDFGISKLLDPDERGAGTRSSPWLTPAYASPEQVRGGPVSTLCDVYALGVILYELLAGVRPYRLDGRSPGEAERVVCEVEPPLPSAQSPDPKVARALRGDLDTITLKALAKESARRYASAEQLGEDLRRYLAGRPVEARPDSWRYRAGKFILRHRTAMSAAGFAAALLVTATVVMIGQAKVTRRERHRAEVALAQSQEVTDHLISMFEAADPARVSTDPVVAREILELGVARADALTGQPLVQASLLDALGMIFLNLNENDRASDLITKALTIRQAHLAPDHPDVAVSLSHLGRALRGQSRYPEALERFQQALAIRLRAQGPHHLDVAASYRDLGFLMPYLGRNDESVRYYRQALDLTRERLGEANATTAEDMMTLGLALRRVGEYREGLALLRQGLALKSRVLGMEDPETARAKFYLADALAQDGQAAEAEQLYREGIASRRQVLGPDDLGLVHGMENLSALLGAHGRGSEAETLLREVVEIRRKRLGDHSTPYAAALNELAAQLAREGKVREAIGLGRQSLRISRETLGPDHATVASMLDTFSKILQRAGKLAEAEEAARQALTIRELRYGPASTLAGLSHIRLASILTGRGRLTGAEAEGLRGLALLTSNQPADRHDLREAHRVLAEAYDAMQRPREAGHHRALAESPQPQD